MAAKHKPREKARTGRLNSPKQLEALRESIVAKKNPKKPSIALCVGTGCLAYGCVDILQAFKNEIAKQKLENSVDVRGTGCPGFCERGALLTIYPQGIFYQRVKIEDVPEIVTETIVKGRTIPRLLYQDPNTKQQCEKEADVPFYKKQQRLLLGSTEGCRRDDDYQCHFVRGSRMAAERLSKVGDTLQQLNLEQERVVVYEVAITDVQRAPRLINDMAATVEKIGMSPFKF